MNLKLVRPTCEYAEQVMRYREAMLANHDRFDGCAGLEEVHSFSEWMDFETRLKAKYGEDYVPSQVFLAVRTADETLVGILDYRQSPLSPFLLQYGGNVGYSVLPSERRKGYAKEMLRQNLQNCLALGIHKVLITCKVNNIASEKTILAAGGIFEKEVEANGHIMKRYWITL